MTPALESDLIEKSQWCNVFRFQTLYQVAEFLFLTLYIFMILNFTDGSTQKPEKVV